MVRAWRLPDGRYRLELSPPDVLSAVYESLADTHKIDWTDVVEEEAMVVGADAVAFLGAEKVYGVVTGPSSCGCEPAMFRWVGELEVFGGITRLRPCAVCYDGPPLSRVAVPHRCDIVDVCGEADVALAVYDAEFRPRVEATA